MELLRRFSDQDFYRALESWTWVPGLTDKKPTIASPFGDVFLQSSDGAYWILDLLEGQLRQCASSAAELQAVLDTPDGQDELLLGGLAHAAWQAGIVPDASQVLTFTIPPVLGGSFAVTNIEVSDFVVTVNLAGQLHEQTRDLPPDTPISGFTIDDEPA
jgi:hypothetical protein